MWVDAMPMIEAMFQPFVQKINIAYNESHATHPRFPFFSLWRIMIKLWITEVYTDLRKDLLISFMSLISMLRQSKNKKEIKSLSQILKM